MQNFERVVIPSDGSSLRRSLAEKGLSKWGWVIYRCTYDNDVAWDNFLHILNTNTRDSLVRDGDEDMWERLEWVIVEDRQNLDGAGTREPRSTYCISVDGPSLASIIAGPQPHNRDIRLQTWVNLIDHQWEESSEEDQEGADRGGGEYTVDECTQWDVGWMKIGAGDLAPRAYSVMEGVEWNGLYKRPTGVQHI